MVSAELQITRAAAEASRALGHGLDEIIRMARQAAVFTDAKANRRYERVTFFVADDTIYGVWPLAERPKLSVPASTRPTHFTPPRRDGKKVVVIDPSSQPRRKQSATGGPVTIDCPDCRAEGCSRCENRGKITVSRERYREIANKLF